MASTYLDHISLHDLGILLVLSPPLGPVEVGVFAERGLVPMDYPPVNGDTGAGGEVLALNFGALGRHVTGDVEPDRWPHPHGLLQAGLEVSEFLCLAPLNVA